MMRNVCLVHLDENFHRKANLLHSACFKTQKDCQKDGRLQPAYFPPSKILQGCFSEVESLFF